MTTVAVKDGVMAADSQCSGGFISRMKKIRRLPDGSLLGFSGHAIQAVAAADWMEGGRVGDPPDMSECTLMLLRPNGKMEYLEAGLVALPLTDKFMAIGSGSTAAMAAMMAGCSALEAVKIAAKLDDGTSGPFHTLKLAAL